MMPKTVTIDGYEYKKMKTIKGKKAIYIEYRNDKLRKIKFFEVKKHQLIEVEEKDDLKLTVEKNYICNNRSE